MCVIHKESFGKIKRLKFNTMDMVPVDLSQVAAYCAVVTVMIDKNR
jgi:hypothetical protein